MPDFDYRYLATLVVDQINDPVAPLSCPVTIGVPGEFLGTIGSGIRRECLNSSNDALTINLGTDCLKLFRGRGLD